MFFIYLSLVTFKVGTFIVRNEIKFYTGKTEDKEISKDNYVVN